MIIVSGKSGSIGKNMETYEGLESRISANNTDLRKELKNKKPDVFIHLAANTSPAPYSADDHFLNAISPRVIYELCAEFGVKLFFFASSGHVYGNHKSRVNESDLTNANSLYAEHKLEAEEQLLSIAGKSPVRLVIARIFSVFGPGMNKKYLAGRISNNIFLNNEISIQNSEDVRDFLSPEEVVRYIEILIGSNKMSHAEVVNICSGSGKSVRDKVLETFPNYQRFNFDGQFSSFPYLVGDNAKLLRIEQKCCLSSNDSSVLE